VFPIFTIAWVIYVYLINDPWADPNRDNGGGEFLMDTHDIDIYIDIIKNINFDIGYLFKLK
jgi:hypothetical protein